MKKFIKNTLQNKESQYSIEHYEQIIKYLLLNKITQKVILFLESPKSPYLKLVNAGAIYKKTDNLSEFISNIAQCKIALTAAGGSSHIASSLNLSVIVISGIKNQSFWRPYGERIKVFENEENINLISPIKISNSIKQFAKR